MLPEELRKEIRRTLDNDRWEDEEQVLVAFERIALLAMKHAGMQCAKICARDGIHSWGDCHQAICNYAESIGKPQERE